MIALGIGLSFFLFNRNHELTLPISEYFPIADYFPGSHFDHPEATANTKVRAYLPGTKSIAYTFRGPKVTEFAPISIDGYALNSSSQMFSDVIYLVVSVIKEYGINRHAGSSLEKREIPVILGDREKIYRIVRNGREVGTLIVIKRGHVVYSYQILGALIVGEQPWRTGILARIKLVESL